MQNLKKLVCACTIARNFGMHTRDSKHMRHTRDACHELELGLPHYTCDITTGTVAVGKLIGFFICCNEHRLIVLLMRRGHTEHSRIFLCH